VGVVAAVVVARQVLGLLCCGRRKTTHQTWLAPAPALQFALLGVVPFVPLCASSVTSDLFPEAGPTEHIHLGCKTGILPVHTN
jgi:hypothetical protein